MSGWKKLASAAAASGDALNVEDVFSTYLYTGDSTSPRTITNGIDLSGEGGLVWFKSRTTTTFHGLFDTERGATKRLRSDSTNAEDTLASDLTAFNSDGFTLGNGGTTNTSPREYASWTFRKAPKFFDIVEYTGNGSTSQTISHNLGSAPGMMIIKSTNNNYSWAVYHREMYETGHYSGSTDPTDFYMLLNGTGKPGYTTGSGFWGNTAPTATEFTVGDNALVNVSGGNFIAYLFAHNNSDGEFGPTGDQDIIKCGRYAGNNTIGHEIELGFEPQFLFLMEMDNNDNRRMFDIMRGMPMSPSDTKVLYPNLSNAEANNSADFEPYQSGFRIQSFTLNTSGNGYAYVAIRRGPMAVPESATDVFAIDQGDSNGTSSVAEFDAGFPVDMGINKATSGSNGQVHTRLTDQKVLYTNYSDAEGNAVQSFDFQNGYYGSDKPSSYYAWMWRRAPSYFDVVAFTAGTSSNRRLDHNLGVAPEMVWVKRRDGVRNWYVYHKDLGDASYGARDYRLYLNSAQAKAGPTIGIWGTSDPTDTDFGLNENDVIGANTSRCIAYMFASAAGVSKVGSFTGTGANGLNIDCGFSSGARFVLIKNVNRSSQWYVWDTERGIVAGNDPWLAFDTAYAQQTSNDYIDPYSAGFTVNYGAADYMNTSGDTHIFYAIA